MIGCVGDDAFGQEMRATLLGKESTPPMFSFTRMQPPAWR